MGQAILVPHAEFRTGLPGNGRWVKVGPPLLASGASFGSSGAPDTPVWFPMPVRVTLLDLFITPIKLLSPATEVGVNRAKSAVPG